jgi:hypothetical protein
MSKKNLKIWATGLWPICKKGKITHLLRDGEDSSDVDLPEGIEGYLESHPEGKDRGGYVPWLDSGKARIYFFDGEWI